MVVFESPIGELKITENDGKLVGIGFGLKGRRYHESNHGSKTIMELEEYFAGKRRSFSNFAKATLDKAE